MNYVVKNLRLLILFFFSNILFGMHFSRDIIVKASHQKNVLKNSVFAYCTSGVKSEINTKGIVDKAAKLSQLSWDLVNKKEQLSKEGKWPHAAGVALEKE